MDFRVISTLPEEPTKRRRFGWTEATTDPTVGMLVEFESVALGTWVGDFAPGLWVCHRSVVPFPDGRRVVVLAEGNAYLVDPDRGRVERQLSEVAIEGYPVEHLGLVVLSWHGIVLEAHTAERLQWRTRRVSWDGICNVGISGASLQADTWSAPYQRWVPVEVDLATGRAIGGTYDGADAVDDEVLYEGR